MAAASDSVHRLMPTPQLSAELLEITSDLREHIVYLHELGIDSLEASETHRSAAVLSDRVGASAATAVDVAEQQRFVPATPPAPVPSLFGELLPSPKRLEKSDETFEQIWADVGDCIRCPLHQGRTHIVHTEGNRRARLMFVGEAPGADEDAQARPFVGRAGQLLTKIIEAIGLKREEVLIGNVNRCRPPGNRPPTEEEATTCKPFLLREIAAVQPEVIVVMGNTAMRNLLNSKQGITRLRGQFQDYQGVKVMPTFHPAYLLRDPSKKKETWEDLKKVRDYLDANAKRKT